MKLIEYGPRAPVRAPYCATPRRLSGRQVAGYVAMCLTLFAAFWLASRIV